MAIKDDYIKIRVSKEQKELFKDIAKKKNISMSKFIIVSTEERAFLDTFSFQLLFYFHYSFYSNLCSIPLVS